MRSKCRATKSLLRPEKTFSFNQGLFFEVGTRFFAKFATPLKSMLWPEKTFLFNQGLFFEVGTGFFAKFATPLKSLLGPKKKGFEVWKLGLPHFVRGIFYSSSLLGSLALVGT